MTKVLNSKPKRDWTMSDLWLLSVLFPTTETKDLAIMFDRSVDAITSQASFRGLKKTKAFFRAKARINIKKAMEYRWVKKSYPH